MRIFITGGSGLIGRRLIARLLQYPLPSSPQSLSPPSSQNPSPHPSPQNRLHEQHHITVLTRNPTQTRQLFTESVRLCSTLEDNATLEGFDAVINLAGESIASRRWTTAGKRILCQSRWQITRRLAELITTCRTPPSVLLSGSAVGYYGDQADREIDEHSTAHDEFTHQLCQQWEQLALRARSAHTRVCLLRTGVVLAAESGMLARLLPLFRAGLGGRIAHGRQYLPWIHIDDLINALLWLLSHNPDSVASPVNPVWNLTAPQPVSNAHFTRSLARALRRPAWLPVPAFALHCLLGESATLLLASQRVLPARLLNSGFRFCYPRLDGALANLLR